MDVREVRRKYGIEDHLQPPTQKVMDAWVAELAEIEDSCVVVRGDDFVFTFGCVFNTLSLFPERCINDIDICPLSQGLRSTFDIHVALGERLSHIHSAQVLATGARNHSKKHAATLPRTTSVCRTNHPPRYVGDSPQAW